MKAFEAAAGTPWAIRQEWLQTILEIALREHEFDPQALSAKLGRPLDNTHTVSYRDGVAVIPIDGPIFPKANLFTEISGATSTDVIARDLQAALDDPAIRSILLEIDSPGGVITGIGELAGMIRAADAQKPVVAYVGDEAASAAYWLASAAREIVTPPTGIVGSIGVVVGVRDPQKNASKSIEFVSSQSPNKRPDPHTERGKSQIQALVDSLADVFVADVARFRSIEPAKVLADFGAGGLKVGRSAVEAGMADRLGTFEGLISELSSGSIFSREKLAGSTQRAAASATPTVKGVPMDEPKTPAAAATPPAAAHAATEPPDSPNPEVVALKAQIERLERANREARASGIKKDATIFADTVIKAGKAKPFERLTIEGQYIQAAADDFAQLDAGQAPAVVFAGADEKGNPVPKKGTRVDALTAGYNARPSHGMFDNRVTTDPLPDGLSLHGNGSQAQDEDAKVTAEARAWAAKRNGKSPAKS